MSLITDTPPLLQPDGSTPFALNVINSTRANGTSSISSEPGVTEIHKLSNHKSVIGQIYFSNKILIFSTDNTTDNIGIIENDVYTRIYSGNLNFNKDHKILGEHRILAGCEDVFYFQDGINPDRYFNLNNIPSDTSLFSVLQYAEEPTIDVVINNTGGRMPSSGVSFLIQYVDLQGNVFESSEPTISLPVYNDTVSPSAQGSTTITNKSATINVSNIDTRFPYIRLVAIHNEEGNYKVYQIDTLYATNTELAIEYQGPTANDIELDNREVQVNAARYNTSLVSEQVQGRLLRANVQELTEDYSGHQRLVNEIIVLPEIVQIPKSEFSQDPNNQHFTFQSDEVYALGIRFISSNKVPSPVYHIPGRESTPGELDDVTYNDKTYQRFEVENTAEEINSSIRGMGYYQTNTLYPNITDCSDSNNPQPIYGSLAGTPVRHHKMPSRRTVALEEGDNFNFINITLNDVTIPGGYNDYEVMYVPRTDANSTVLDSGYLNMHYNGIGEFDEDFDVIVHTFASSKSLIESNIKGTYFDIQNMYTKTTVSLEEDTDLNGYDFATFEIFGTSFIRNTNTYSFYENNAYIQPNSTDNSTFYEQILNPDVTQTTNNYDIEVKDIYEGVGEAPDRPEVYYFYAVNKRLISVNNNVQSLIYKPLNNVNKVYQGDTFIFKYQALTGAAFQSTTLDNPPSVSASVFEFYVESNVNSNLYYGDHYTSGKTITYIAARIDRALISQGAYIGMEEEYTNNQGYNYGSIKSYFPLPLTYDYCDRCRSKNPTRIIYSPQSFQEELSDAYLISNTNDYIDLPANTGPITGLKYKSDRLYVHTTQTTYVLSPNPQYLSTNQLVAQLQTGDFLSIPAQEIIQTDYGYGGLQSKTGTQNNEYGYFWVDGLRGSLNSITDSFNSVSNKGMMNWFKTNTNESSEVIMAFDPFYHRLITTIKNNNHSCSPYHTISYHLNSQSFTCFHDWGDEPDFYLNNSTKFYSTYNNRIKRHDQENGYNQFSHVIEQVDKKMTTHNLISLTHYTEFYEDDQEVVDTFSNLIIYNSNQSSGKLNLSLAGPYDNLFHTPGRRVVTIRDKNHNVANIWDNSISQIVTQGHCNEPVYTDKRFVNVRQEDEHYDKPIFKEKYTIARLTHKPTRDIRFTHYLLQQNKQQSIR
jgi:hypothetical protein